MKLNIWIETNESTFASLMLNYIKELDDKECINVMLLNNIKVNETWLQQHDVTIIRYNQYAMLGNALNSVANIILGNEIAHISIHASLSIVREHILSFLASISVYMSGIQLSLYEESMSELLVSRFVNDLRPGDFQKLTNNYSKTIASSIKNKNKIPKENWNTVANYSLHKILNTTYYLQQNSALKNTKKFPTGKLDELEGGRLKDYLDLFSISESIYNSLKSVKHKALLLIAPVLLHEELQQNLQSEFKNKVNNVIQNELVKNKNLILYRDGDIELFPTAPSIEGMMVLKIPSVFTINLLKAINLLPEVISGPFTAELLQSPDKNIAFSFTNEVIEEIKSYIIESNLNIAPPFYLSEFSQRKRYRVFCCPGSLGDVIYALGSVNSLRKIYSEEFIFIARKLYKELVESFPLINHFIDMANPSDEERIITSAAKLNKDFYYFGRWEQIVAKKHMTDAFLECEGFSFEDEDKQPSIVIKNINKKKVDDFIASHDLSKNKVVLLHPNIGSPNRTWTEDGWSYLAKQFISDGWTVLIIGSDNNKYQEKKMMAINEPLAIDCVNKFSVIETIYLMEKCQLLVACDSGPVGLAGLTNIAICALYSIIPSEYRLPYRNGRKGWNALGINTGCQYGQCGHLILNAEFFEKKLNKQFRQPIGHDFSDWCPNDNKYLCMKTFSPEYFWSEIQVFLNSESYVHNKS
ncbi:hypothetical protein MUU49_16670 [Scandinavium goeteborgense]|uniref:glycosyltransferase family 9 protein n=1 Tax=Scandinavium goeteborgense TaxID=1851514 RepID=UPI0021653D5E|nr:glycosyltransferase family 9 protein [Scandinavium goeteborgense]MCS2154192.1 hypothetical protein [Scandinavium goeteborgense]